MKISTSKSKAVVLDLKNMASYLQVSREPKPQVKKFKNHGVLFVSEGRMEQQIVAAVSSTGWQGAPLRVKWRSSAIRVELGIELLLLHIKESELRRLGHPSHLERLRKR